MTDTTTALAVGTPIWVDLGSSDPQASARFYGQLFGWQAEDLGEEVGHYTMFSQDGKRVAAVGEGSAAVRSVHEFLAFAH